MAGGYNQPSMLLCPNCGSPVDSAPVRCARCGYRSEMAGEYFWLYAGGCIVILAGFLLGALGIAIEGAPPGHWSRTFDGWFPIAPWPSSHRFLAYLVLGVALTGCGLGITRRKPAAWLALLAIALYELAMTVPMLPPLRGEHGGSRWVVVVLGGEILLLLLAARMGIALRRTPRAFCHRHSAAGHRESPP